jgi:hypothetical protein
LAVVLEPTEFLRHGGVAEMHQVVIDAKIAGEAMVIQTAMEPSAQLRSTAPRLMGTIGGLREG